MLRQEKYIGDTLWQKTYSEFMGKQFQTNYGQQTKYYLRDTHPAIISHEDFELVKEIKANSAHRYGNDELTGLLFKKRLTCGKCGHMYSYFQTNQKGRWCCSYKDEFDVRCNNISVYDADMHQAFTALCDKLRENNNEIFGECIKSLEKLFKAKESRSEEEIAVLKMIAELKEKKHRLSKLLTKHFIEPDKYSEQVFEIDNTIRRLNSSIQKEPMTKNQLIVDIENSARMFRGYDGSEEYQKMILDSVIEHITICEDGSIKFKLSCGLEFTERVK